MAISIGITGTRDISKIDNVSVRFQTSIDERLDSPRTDGWFANNNLKYQKLQCNFSNLVLQSGFTYKLVIERYKKSKKLGNEGRYGGYRKTNIAAGINGVFASRPAELEITSLSQWFDFRNDLYYSSSYNYPFPRPSGFGKPSYQRNSSTQFFAFRISKTNDSSGVVELSKVIGTAKLIGTLNGNYSTAYWNLGL
jgi:hypothetical protein